MNTGPERQQAEGAWDKMKGSVKEAIGDATDNESLQAEGMWDKTKGHAKDAIGTAREGVRDTLESGDETDRATGVWDEVAGRAKEAFGSATGNASLEAEGHAQHTGGAVRGAMGAARHALADRV